MADWYVSSTSWTALPQFAASGVYTVGQIVRPLTAPAIGKAHAFRCTTAGTASTEPVWPTANNGTVTTGGATFTNVTGQSAYGWGAAAGDLNSISAGAGWNRPVTGDRVFASSDHSETGPATSNGLYFGSASTYGLIQVISVNRAGAVPPGAADIQNGASYTFANFSNMTLDAQVDMFWQGFTFTYPGTSTANIAFAWSFTKTQYFKNCSMVITNTATGTRFGAGNAMTSVILDNTTVSFGNASQAISCNTTLNLTWINTPAAIQGTAPSTLFQVGGNTASFTCRGIDLGAVTGTLVLAGPASTYLKVLLESSKIASGVVRYSTPGTSTPTLDEVELVNCYDGTNVLNERHTPAGDITTDRSTYLTSGAQDDIGNYSLKMISSARNDFATFPLDCFAFDVENTLTGTSHTATVEIVSSLALNNNDIRLLLEYMGTSGSPVASFGDSLSSVLTAASALPSSSNTWIGPASTTWNVGDRTAINLTNNNLTATSTAASAGVRALMGAGAGKYYFEVTIGNNWNSTTGAGVALPTVALPSNLIVAGVAAVEQFGLIYINGSSSGINIGARGSGDIIGIAVDIGASLIWFRVAPSGNWNNSGTANPATGAGGLSISAMSGVLFPIFLPTFTADACTLNAGASAFSGAVPSGFTAGWSGTPASKQLLQVSFTPQRAGRVRGLVRLGKVSTTVWVNPQVSIS